MTTTPFLDTDQIALALPAHAVKARMTLAKLRAAPRPDLVRYLQGWGFACADHESTDDLRTAAVRTYRLDEPV